MDWPSPEEEEKAQDGRRGGGVLSSPKLEGEAPTPAAIFGAARTPAPGRSDQQQQQRQRQRRGLQAYSPEAAYPAAEDGGDGGALGFQRQHDHNHDCAWRRNRWTSALALAIVSSATVLAIARGVWIAAAGAGEGRRRHTWWGDDAAMADGATGGPREAAERRFLPLVLSVLAALCAIPFLLFPLHVAVSGVFNAFGSLRFLQQNSRHFAVVRAAAAAASTLPLPSVTVQMPVYRESLRNVLAPSLRSLLQAKRAYERLGRGARCNVVVSDDGLQAGLPEEECEARVSFYRAHGVAFVARPLAGRRGRFRKASNLNCALRHAARQDRRAVAERKPEGEEEDKEEGVVDTEELVTIEGDVRVGDLVLLVDADTRVPRDCIVAAAREFLRDPELGFTQHLTTPLAVTRNAWEDFIAHFTRYIYTEGIAQACAGGDPAPLVGHNAFLRASACREAAKLLPDDHPPDAWWSEDHVSEDFDMAMRLQSAGFHGRYVAHTGYGFLEGVSLSYDDEVIRFRKYAFGAAELCLKPLGLGWFRCGEDGGPLAPQIRRYLGSSVPWHAKVNLLGYLGTYFAVAFGFAFAPIWLVGASVSPAFRDETVPAIDALATSLLVFAVWAPLSSGFAKYRLSRAGDLVTTLAREFRYVPHYAVFFGSIQFHVFAAIASHMVGLTRGFRFDASRKLADDGSTDEDQPFFDELRRVFRAHRFMYLWMAALLVLAIVCRWGLPVWTDGRLGLTATRDVAPCLVMVATHTLGPLLFHPTLSRLRF